MNTTQAIAQQIEHGMVRAFFASAYADAADECGQPLRGEILDQLPEPYDPAAYHAARTLWVDMERTVGRTVPAMFEQCSGGLSPTDWGHYAAMQAMGHGVGLWEYDVELKIPYVEFGCYSLSRDYFEPTVD